MTPEHIVVQYPHNIIIILWVLIIQKFQDLKLYTCLVLKSFLIPDNFNRYNLLRFMVKAFDSLAE